MGRHKTRPYIEATLVGATLVVALKCQRALAHRFYAKKKNHYRLTVFPLLIGCVSAFGEWGMQRLPTEFAGTTCNDRLIGAERIGEQPHLATRVFERMALNNAPLACCLAHGMRRIGNSDERIINTVKDSRGSFLYDKPVEFSEVLAVHKAEAVISIAHMDNGLSLVRRCEERFQNTADPTIDHSRSNN